MWRCDECAVEWRGSPSGSVHVKDDRGGPGRDVALCWMCGTRGRRGGLGSPESLHDAHTTGWEPRGTFRLLPPERPPAIPIDVTGPHAAGTKLPFEQRRGDG